MSTILSRSGRAVALGLLGVLGTACSGGRLVTSTRSSTGAPSTSLSPEVPLSRLGPSRTTGTAPSFAVLCPGPTSTTPYLAVPAVVGLDLEDAVDHVVCLGLRVELDPSDASKAGLVTGQTPRPGAEVPVGGTVLLRVHAPG